MIAVTLPSGSKLEMTEASFEEGCDLLEIVSAELGQVKLALGIKPKEGESLLQGLLTAQLGDEAIDTLKNVITRLIASKAVKAALWKCVGRTALNGVKVTPDYFEDTKARADYLPMLKEVLVFNLGFFTKDLSSLLLGLNLPAGLDGPR
jgi:hypothetical protein